MKAVEFIIELTGKDTLSIPTDAIARLPASGKARVIVIPDDDADEKEWRAASYEQFLRDDSEEDAAYEALR